MFGITVGLYATRGTWLGPVVSTGLVPEVVAGPLLAGNLLLTLASWAALILGSVMIVGALPRWVHRLSVLALMLAVLCTTNLTTGRESFGARANLEANRSRWLALAAEIDRDQANSRAAGVTPSSGYYSYLPAKYADLTYEGMYTEGDGHAFFPLWAGIPDDAGGLWWSPGKSPEGWDMWGLECRGPVDLSGGWWSCGVRP